MVLNLKFPLPKIPLTTENKTYLTILALFSEMTGIRCQPLILPVGSSKMPDFFKRLDRTVGKYPFTHQHWLTVLTLIFAGLLLFLHLGSLPLIVPDEGRNAEVAREMAISGNWLVPTYNDIAYLDKPAFYFKTVALSFQAFGESELTARLSSAVFGFSLLLALFFFCKRVYDLQTARLAVLVTATTPLFIIFSRTVIFDMTLAFFVSSTLFSCYLAEDSSSQKEQKRWYLLGAACAGIATLVKGPVGFILPTLVISFYNYTAGNRGFFKRCFAVRNWILFLAIVLPWFIGLSLERPDFPYYGIMKESISRFTTQEFKRTQPIYFYALIIAGTFFAWSLLLPQSLGLAWKQRTNLHKADRFFILWAITVVIFFSLSQSKLPGYILTVTVTTGALIARIFVKAKANIKSDTRNVIRNGALAFSIITLIATVILVHFIVRPGSLLAVFSDKPWMAELFKPSLPHLAITLFVISLLSWIAAWKRNPNLIFAAFCSFTTLLLIANFHILSSIIQPKTNKGLASYLEPHLKVETELMCLECYPNSLPFYLKRPILVVSNNGAELTSNYILYTLQTSKAWPENIIPWDKLESRLAESQHPIFLLSMAKKLDDLQKIATQRGSQVELIYPGYWGVLLNPIKVN